MGVCRWAPASAMTGASATSYGRRCPPSIGGWCPGCSATPRQGSAGGARRQPADPRRSPALPAIHRLSFARGGAWADGASHPGGGSVIGILPADRRRPGGPAGVGRPERRPSPVVPRRSAMTEEQAPARDGAAPAAPGSAVDAPALILTRRYWLLLVLAAV